MMTSFCPHMFITGRNANNVVAFTRMLSLSDMGNMDDTNNDRHYLKEQCNTAKKMMRKHHAYYTTKFHNLYVQSPCSTRSAVTIFLSSS